MLINNKQLYLRVEFCKYWPGMLFGLEVAPRSTKEGFELIFSLTVLCCLVLEIEYFKYYGDGNEK